MSSKGRSIRSQLPSNMARPSQSSTIPTVTIPPRVAASVSGSALRDRLLDDYNFAFDQGNQISRRLKAKHNPSMTVRYLNGMILTLDNVEDIVERMERVGPGDWQFARPSIGHWQETLANFLEAPTVVKSFNRIGDLSTRVFALCGKTGEGLMTGPGHAGQSPGTRCIQCAISCRACSFVMKVKATPANLSCSKKTVEEEVEVEEEITPPKAKGKGILGVLLGKLKRKQGNRSPGEELSNKPPSRSSVRLIVPLPPHPLSDYVQLGARLSQPPFASPASPSFDLSMGQHEQSSTEDEITRNRQSWCHRKMASLQKYIRSKDVLGNHRGLQSFH